MSGKFALRIARGGLKADIERLWALDFDGQSSNLTVGETITGGTSGATGTLVEQTDDGASGTLILSHVSGEFQDNESLSDEGSGDGTVDGTLYAPQLAPSDEVILQIDASQGMTKSELLEALRMLRMAIVDGELADAA